MTISELIKEVDKVTVHNLAEAKSKMLLPTYRFVTSVNFALVVIAVAILLATILLHNAFAYSQDVVDRNGIKDIKINGLNTDTSIVSFDYCLNKYSVGSVGALVFSDLDVVPVPINSDNIQYKECVTYGAKILTESDTVTVTLFQQDRIVPMLSSFNAKVHELKNMLAQVNQQINEHGKLNDNNAINHLTQKAQLLERQIKSVQSGLKTLIAMKGS